MPWTATNDVTNHTGVLSLSLSVSLSVCLFPHLDWPKTDVRKYRRLGLVCITTALYVSGWMLHSS